MNTISIEVFDLIAVIILAVCVSSTITYFAVITLRHTVSARRHFDEVNVLYSRIKSQREQRSNIYDQLEEQWRINDGLRTDLAIANLRSKLLQSDTQSTLDDHAADALAVANGMGC